MMRSLFDKSRLPSPPAYFDSIGLKLTGKGAWRSALCPFHDDTRASLRVQYALGAFRCMATTEVEAEQTPSGAARISAEFSRQMFVKEWCRQLWKVASASACKSDEQAHS